MSRGDLTGVGGFSVPGVTRLSQVGRGGFATVYRGYQERFDRWVAVKVLDTESLDAAALRRFERECAIMGRLSDHPNVVTIYDSGMLDDRRPYLLTEFCGGGSLYELLRRSGPLAVAQVVSIGHKLASALDAAHRIGIIHRDIKPGNVLLRASGEPAMADFGLSLYPDRDSSRGLDAFSLEYAAPESLARGERTTAGDLYAMGATLYATLTGGPPFPLRQGEAPMPFLNRLLAEPVPPVHRPDLPDDLRDLLNRLLEKEPERRPGGPELLSRLAALRQVVGPAADLDPGTVGTWPHPPPRRAATMDVARDMVRDVAAGTHPTGAPPRVPGDPVATVATGPTGPAVPPGSGRVASPGLIPDPGAGDGASGWSATTRLQPQAPHPRTPRPARSRRGLAIVAGGTLAAAVAVAAILSQGGLGTGGTPTTTPPSQVSEPGSGGSGGGAGDASGGDSQGGSGGGSTDEDVGTGGQGSTGTPGGGTVPDGFELVSAPGGLRLAIPASWEVVDGAVASNHQANDPADSGRFVRYGGEPSPDESLLATITVAEQNLSRRDDVSDYQRLKLERVEHGNAEEAVDWEFTFAREGVVRHAHGRYWRLNGRDYVAYASAPHADFEEEMAGILDVMIETASPT